MELNVQLTIIAENVSKLKVDGEELWLKRKITRPKY